MKKYQIYIKSHCEAPDYENEGKANSKKEFAEKLMDFQMAEFGWSVNSLMDFIQEVED